MSEPFVLTELWQALADGVVDERERFSRPWRFAFHVREVGSFLLDVGQGTIRPVEPDSPVDAAMTTNLSSLEDLAEGRLDPSAPQPGQVCVLTGDRAAWEELSVVLGRR